MKKVNVGKNIKTIRLSLNLTQKQFGQKMEVSRSTINHWENGEALPNVFMLRKMKQVFGISYEEIIDGI